MINNIPIFDSITHPTIDGNWILPKWPNCASIDDLKTQMRHNDICGAFAVGMDGIGQYSEDAFVKMINKKGDGLLHPIAFYHQAGSVATKACEEKLLTIKRKGYEGIKIHPRMAHITMEEPLLPFIIDKANELGLVVMLCTYFYSNSISLSSNNNEKLAEMLTKLDSNSKVILLHGGAVKLLETMEIVRGLPNVILDLSFTLCKYAGSSLDLDIQYLFQSFDRRICVGSDHPEIKLNQLRERFNYFASKTTFDKAENIAYKNILRFTGLKL